MSGAGGHADVAGAHGTLAGARCFLSVDGNTVAVSLRMPAAMLGVHVRVASPPAMSCPNRDRRLTAVARHGATIDVTNDARQAVAGADAFTPTSGCRGQEKQAARAADARSRRFRSTRLVADGLTRRDFITACRRTAGSSDERRHGLGRVGRLRQAENRLHTEKALLALLMGR